MNMLAERKNHTENQGTKKSARMMTEIRMRIEIETIMKGIEIEIVKIDMEIARIGIKISIKIMNRNIGTVKTSSVVGKNEIVRIILSINQEMMKIDIEIVKIDTETGRIEIENGRIDTENGRIDIETGRIDIEIGRIDIEIVKIETGTMKIAIDIANVMILGIVEETMIMKKILDERIGVKMMKEEQKEVVKHLETLVPALLPLPPHQIMMRVLYDKLHGRRDGTIQKSSLIRGRNHPSGKNEKNQRNTSKRKVEREGRIVQKMKEEEKK